MNTLFADISDIHVTNSILAIQSEIHVHVFSALKFSFQPRGISRFKSISNYLLQDRLTNK